MPTPTPLPLGAADLAELERLLEAVPAPLEPLDATMLDGFLCGVLLQPTQVPPARWLPHITDIEQARALPRDYPAKALHELVSRRFAQLNEAIEQRQWFDPWIFEPDEDDDGPLDTILPWVAGFAAAVDLLPSVLQTSDERVLEGQALLYRAFNPDDLEDADALLAVMAELEPPEDLDEVVEDLVTAVFLLADVTRPSSASAAAAQAAGAADELEEQEPAPSRAPAAQRAQPTRPAVPARPNTPAARPAPTRPGPGHAGPGKNAAGKIAPAPANRGGSGKPGGAAQGGQAKPGQGKPTGKPSHQAIGKPAGKPSSAKPAAPRHGGSKPPRSGSGGH